MSNYTCLYACVRSDITAGEKCRFNELCQVSASICYVHSSSLLPTGLITMLRRLQNEDNMLSVENPFRLLSDADGFFIHCI